MLIVNFQIVFAISLPIFLVKYTQQTFKTVTSSSGEERNLHDDAVMSQTLYEGIGRRKRIVVIIQIAAVHVNHRLGQVTQGVSQNVDRNDGQTICTPLSMLILFFDNVLLIKILRAQILSEAQGFSNEPSLLQFDKDKVFCTVILTNLC